MLNKNLNFVPNPGQYNKAIFQKDKYSFFRNTILKAHFGNKNKYTYTGLKPKTNNQWIPKEIHHSVKSFIEAVNTDLENENRQQRKHKYNLTKDERLALSSLMHKEDIIITQADKGGEVCIISIDDYIKEAKRQLDNTEFYTKLPVDPTNTHNDLINNTIRNFAKENLLPMHVTNALITENPKTARYYQLPKVHKIKYPAERTDVPGRPIISSINSPTAAIARFVDYYLQPITQKLKSYIKDTTDFLNKLENIGSLPENSILVTMDVKSLYTNIPHAEGINAVAKALEQQDEQTISTRVIIKFLSLILNLNNFTFNDDNILQIKGCAMGAKCSSSYGNIFMGEFEKNHINPLIDNDIKCYFRYIDDIFFIWTGREIHLLEVFQKINKIHLSIKFDCKYSFSEINFLDTTITINNDLTITTKLHTKETDRNAYLHYNSYHPTSMKNNIPYGQALRVKTICTNETDLSPSLHQMKEKFTNRGYPRDIIEKQLNRAKSIERKDLLKKSRKDPENTLRFCTTYNKGLPNIRNAMNNNWHLLHINKKISSTFSTMPILAFRRNKNLKELIGQHHLSGNKKITSRRRKSGKCQPCLSQRGNICCKHILSTNAFKSNVTKKSYDIRHNLNCHSKNVIYLGDCTLCPTEQYVGKTETRFNTRLYNHRKDTKKTDSIPFDQHFRLPNHDFTQHARFILIEQVNASLQGISLTKLIEQREDFWISELQTLQPNGNNVQLNSATTNQIRVICN